MDDEAMKAMARRIAKRILGNLADDGHVERAALAAIIETRDRDAALADELTDAANSMVRVYDYSEKSRVVTLLRKAAAAIRSGQKDV